MKSSITNEILDSYNKGFTQTADTELLDPYYQALAENEPKYITAQNGVQFNPDAPPENKEIHTIEAPKASTQHF